jgi:hypothetical protein
LDFTGTKSLNIVPMDRAEVPGLKHSNPPLLYIYSAGPVCLSVVAAREFAAQLNAVADELEARDALATSQVAA